MRDRHINIEPDSKLLKQVYARVNDELKVNRVVTAAMLLFKFFLYFSIFVFCYYALYFTQNSILFILIYICFGLVIVLLGFNFAHDFSHNTIFKNKRLNNFLFVSIYTLAGAHAQAWKFRHIHSHHYAPNVSDYDSDLQITTLIRVEPGSEHKWFHKYQHWYAPVAYTSYSLYWVFIKDFVIYFEDVLYPNKKTFTYHLSFWLQKVIYLVCLIVLPVIYSVQPWYITVGAFLVMHLIQSFFLLFTFFITHHVEKTAYFETDTEGYIKTSWINNQVKSSNDFYPFSEAANFIFGGFNNHIAHHLFPHINHIHYPKLNKILYKILNEHGIEPNVTGFFSGITSHLKHLKAMSVKPYTHLCKDKIATKVFKQPFV